MWPLRITEDLRITCFSILFAIREFLYIAHFAFGLVTQRRVIFVREGSKIAMEQW
jgi:hypothetical protein